MSRKIFGIDTDRRIDVPTGLRRSGVEGGKGIYDQYFNQALFEVHQDHIIGTAVQLTAGDATLKYLSSDQTLRDKDNSIVVLNNDDRVYIIGLDTLTADFDLSTYDRLIVLVDPSISLANGSQDLIFGDESVLDIYCDDSSNVNYGTQSRGHVNRSSVGIDFSSALKGVFDGIEAEVWRLTADFSSDAVITAWELAEENAPEAILPATGLISLASGVFTFASTGWYLAMQQARVTNTAGASNANGTSALIEGTNNGGGAWATLSQSSQFTPAANFLGSISCLALIKVVAIASQKIRISCLRSAVGDTILGSTSINYSTVSFIKLAGA